MVLASNPSDVRLDPRGLILAIQQKAFIALASVYAVGAAILVALSPGRFGREWVFIDVGAGALFGQSFVSYLVAYTHTEERLYTGGFTVLSTKAFSTLLTMEWWEVFAEWITYPLLAVCSTHLVLS